MAYFSQEKKKEIQPKINAILKKWGLKGSLKVNHGMEVVLNIRSGGMDFISSFMQKLREENPNWIHWNEDMIRERCTGRRKYLFRELTVSGLTRDYDDYAGKCMECLRELTLALNNGNFDKSDSQSDYFHVGWYWDICFDDYKINI